MPTITYNDANAIGLILPKHIAESMAKRLRDDMDHAAEQSAICLTHADRLFHASERWKGAGFESTHLAMLDNRDEMIEKSKEHDARFAELETICKALTEAGI